MDEEFSSGDEEQVPARTQRTKRSIYLLLALVVVTGIGVFFGIRVINATTWRSRLSATSIITPIRDTHGTWAYQITLETDSANTIQFASSVVAGVGNRFEVSSCDLLLGNNLLLFNVERDGHTRPDSVIIDNTYAPITLFTEQSYDNLYSTTRVEIVTEPGNTLSFMRLDTVLVDGHFSMAFDPDSVLEPYDPDRTPVLMLREPVTVSNPTGNERTLTEDLFFHFPRVEIEVSDPWNSYISRTGSSYTIKGYGDQGVRVTLSGAASGSVTIGSGGTFSKWVSVPDFGENYYMLVASSEGFTSDTVVVTIFREMTEAEMIREYKDQCEHVSAEYLRQHQSSLVGDHVRVWGRTVEYFSGSWLHLVDGDDHWIADLSGFDQIPRLVGLSCYCWGKVTSDSRSFSTSGGDYVTAPVVDAMYYEVSY